MVWRFLHSLDGDIFLGVRLHLLTSWIVRTMFHCIVRVASL
jgi:hypothetical protein